MRDILLAAMVFGSIPFIFYRPHIGVLVWAWLSYMTPHRFTWSFSYDFRFALVIAAVTLLAWLISKEPKRIPWKLPVIAMMAFWVWTGVTTLFAMFPDQAQDKWVDLTKIILIDGIVTIAVFRSRARITALLWVIVASIGFFGIKGGMFTLLTGGVYRVGGVDDAYFSDNNLLAAALLMTIPLMRYLQLTTERRIVQWGLLAAMALCMVAVLGTQSRGGLVGLLVLLLLMLFRSRRKFLVVFGIGLTVVAAITFMPQKWHDRMATIITYEEDDSAQSRFASWEYGLSVAQESPVTGGGFKAFLGNKVEGVSGGYRSAHSIYFQVLGEHGFTGLGLYCLLLVSALVLGSSVARRSKQHPELAWAQNLAQMTQISLVVFATAGAFLSLAYFELVIHLVAITVVMDAIVRRELSETTESSSMSGGHRRTALGHEPSS